MESGSFLSFNNTFFFQVLVTLNAKTDLSDVVLMNNFVVKLSSVFLSLVQADTLNL